MTFALANLENHAGSGAGRKIFTYYTTDTLATVAASGYFNGADLLLSAGDIILLVVSDGMPITLSVESITSGVVVVAGGGWATEEGVGMSDAAAIYHNVWQEGGFIRSQIRVDLTGLRSTAAGDLIGNDGAGVCYLGQVTAARNGAIQFGTVRCEEVPAGGDPDINLSANVEATGVEDTAESALTGTGIILNAGDWSVGLSQALTGVPAADEYLYISAGATTDADYTTGVLVIDLWGL